MNPKPNQDNLEYSRLIQHQFEDYLMTGCVVTLMVICIFTVCPFIFISEKLGVIKKVRINKLDFRHNQP